MTKSATLEKFVKLLNLLSFNLQHKDYVRVWSMIYDLKIGNLSKEEMVKIYRRVAHIEYEFKNYSTYSVIKGGKKESK